MSFRNNLKRNWTDIKEALLNSRSIHLWLADVAAFDLRAVVDALSIEEKKRGDKFYFAKDRKTYLVCRGLLRFLLAKYTDVSAREIEFVYNRFGKPEANFSSSEQMFFNISHSGDFCFLAFSRSNRIGIDLELIKSVDYELLAKNIFSSAEKVEFQSIPAHLKPQAFYCGWTRKESFIKGIGKGLSFPLKSFSVALSPETAVSKVETLAENAEFSEWEIYDISFDSNYCGALAVENPDVTVFETFFVNEYFS